MRVYLPASVADLQDPRGLSARTAYAVTPGLRRALPDEDDEGLEFAAFLAAADASIDVCERGRVVVSADIAGATDGERVAEVAAPAVPWDRVASIHIDDVSDQDCRDQLIAARAGDTAAREELGEADLLWYDVSERDEIIALLRHS